LKPDPQRTEKRFTRCNFLFSFGRLCTGASQLTEKNNSCHPRLVTLQRRRGLCTGQITKANTRGKFTAKGARFARTSCVGWGARFTERTCETSARGECAARGRRFARDFYVHSDSLRFMRFVIAPIEWRREMRVWVRKMRSDARGVKRRGARKSERLLYIRDNPTAGPSGICGENTNTQRKKYKGGRAHRFSRKGAGR
jgi:hypothetical protein